MDSDFKFLCMRNLYLLNRIDVPAVTPESTKEAVLYTYSAEPHLEFLIRNTLIRLGPGWSHTVICGVQNVGVLTDICSKIDTNIRIINTGHTALTLPEHTRFMTSASFWRLISGKTVLLYQEDCCIFDKIPDSLLQLDFIVSGGLSIRNRDKMIECIRRYSGKIRATREADFFSQALQPVVTDEQNELFRSVAGFRFWNTYDWQNRVLALVGRHINSNPPVRIYILCHTKERLESAATIYAKYPWAYPILMKYQDFSFENAFWQQLLEIQDDWASSEFVGTLSWSAHRKTNIGLIHKHLTEGLYAGRSYVNFTDTGVPVRAAGISRYHPRFSEIWDDVTKALYIDDVTENSCNYWMCTPDLMKGFIRWHAEICRPLLVGHPLIFTDAKYGGAMTEQELMALWSMPYYPHVPFIMERLNKAFFDNTERVWFYDTIDIFEDTPSDSSGLITDSSGLIKDSSGLCEGLITDLDAGLITGLDAGLIVALDAGLITDLDAGLITDLDAGPITDSSGLSYARSDIGSEEIRIVTPDLISNHCEQISIRLNTGP